ncbi:MAG: shikimate dehydrogenase family protein [Flavobacteriales bacterium]
MKTFGLIGRSLSHSFSKTYFQNKFRQENIKNCRYVNLEIAEIQRLFQNTQIKQLNGFNVTIPYKETIIPLLDELETDAQQIGAVNCVSIKNGKYIGHNTDYIGFIKSLQHLNISKVEEALILGSGGASKAIAFAFSKLNIDFKIISRKSENNYESLSNKNLSKYNLIVNTTPLGTFPDINQSPALPYHLLNNNNILYDLTYNPSSTMFLKKGLKQGCQIKNGLEMLHIQAEESWRIWNEEF